MAIKKTATGTKEMNAQADIVLNGTEDEDLDLASLGVLEEQITLEYVDEFHNGVLLLCEEAVENAKAFSDEGTGLGLVIVKEVVDRLKGTISVESREGEGTRFICLLPGAKDLGMRPRTTPDER